MSYRALDIDAINATCERLGARIGERFPESGLHRISKELLDAGRETRQRIDLIRKPHWPIRISVAAILVLGLMLIVHVGSRLSTGSVELGHWASMLQTIESGINDVVFLAIAVFFLVSIEARIKRRKTLRALHQLRSIAHVIDMHQLTKDPEQLLSNTNDTASSPVRSMNRFQLARYLDYCSELLAITGKIAAFHVQFIDDAQVMGAVSDIQHLTTALSSKIWQKITIINGIAPSANEAVKPSSTASEDVIDQQH